MKKNDNSSSGAFIISLTFAVVVFTALYIQHKPFVPAELTETAPLVEEVLVEESNAIESVEEEVITPEPLKVIPFAQAYAIARGALGPGQVFTWNGNQYSTNTTEENVQIEEDPEPTLNLADGQDSLTLSHALTP